MNHFKDEEEAFETTKLLCRFMNPQAAATIFDGKTTDVTVSTKDTFYEQMSKDLKDKYTPEQLADIMANPKRYAELDVIEKAN